MNRRNRNPTLVIISSKPLRNFERIGAKLVELQPPAQQCASQDSKLLTLHCEPRSPPEPVTPPSHSTVIIALRKNLLPTPLQDLGSTPSFHRQRSFTTAICRGLLKTSTIHDGTSFTIIVDRDDHRRTRTSEQSAPVIL